MKLVVEKISRLDHFLDEAIVGTSRTKISAWIDAGHVRIDGVTQRKHGLKLKPGQQVEWDEFETTVPQTLNPEELKLEIPYEDEHLLIVNKPRGLVTHPAPSYEGITLVHALLYHSKHLSGIGGDFRPGIVHRLDKETTGLIAIAKSDAVHVALARQFEHKTAERRYFAVVAGEFENSEFNIEAPIGRNPKNRQQMAVVPGGKSALTHCKVIGRFGDDSILAVKLSTGRTHQIRVHLRSIGHPVFGDTVYSPKPLHVYPLQLHAAWLSLVHPISGEKISIYCPPPEDFLGHDRVGEGDIQF